MRLFGVGVMRSRGVTMVELVIAMGVLALALMALLSVFFAASTHRQASADRTQALKACQDVMERMLALPFDEMTQRVPYDPTSQRWELRFVARKVDAVRPLGRVEVTFVDPDRPETVIPTPTQLARITVEVSGHEIGLSHVNERIVTWRSRR